MKKMIVAAIALLVNLSSAKDLKLLNINTTTIDSMASHLPGVGPALAARLDSARRVSPFSSCDDLDKVKGIGSAKLAKICPMVRF